MLPHSPDTDTENLISNAIKHHDKLRGRITVAAHRVAGRLCLEAEDEGPAIEPLYQARIFELFQTLRSSDEVEGNGLDLTNVSKLTERYGGMLALVSDPSRGRGACFKADLPDFTDALVSPVCAPDIAAE